MKTSIKRLYKLFHGRKVDDEFTIDIEPLDKMFLIGEVVAVEYKACKHDDEHEFIYRHRFKKGDFLLANNTVLLIVGENLKIKKEGIIN